MEPKTKDQIRQLKRYFFLFAIVTPLISATVMFLGGGGVSLLLYYFSVLNAMQLKLALMFWPIDGLTMALPLLFYKARAVRLLIRELKREDATPPPDSL